MAERDNSGRQDDARHSTRSRNYLPLSTYRTTAALLLILLACTLLTAGCTGNASANATVATPNMTETTAVTPPATATAVLATTQTTATSIVTKTTTVKPTTTRTATTVTTPAKTYTRPATGTVIAGKRILGGYAELRIDNENGSRDIVAVLTRWHSTTPLFGVYIRHGDSHENEYIKDGMYDLYVLAGENWDPEGNRFDGDVAMLKLKDPLRYVTSMDERNVTVFPADEADDAMETVPAAGFPDL